MRKILFLYSMLFICDFGLADVFYRNKTEYRSSPFAQKYFGERANDLSTQGIDFGHIEADISTQMDCGRIDVVTNFEAQFNKIRQQAEAFVSDIKGYTKSAPFMGICYMMPQACAQIRHDHFQFAQNLNLKAQSCAAIDKFINNQAEIGAKQLEADAKRRCIEQTLSKEGEDMASATEACHDVSGMPLRDLSSGLKKSYLDKEIRKQRVLKAMLDSVGEGGSYVYLSSLLGEIEIQSDGYWQPLWPHKMYKPHEVAKNTFSDASRAVCNDLKSILDSRLRLSQNSINETIREKLNQEDLEALDDLLDADKKMACSALGRALGAIAVKKSAAKNEAVVSTALTNGALTQGLKEEYRQRSSRAFETLRLAVESEQIPNVEDVRRAVRDLAAAQRKYNRNIASSLSRSKISNETERRKQTQDCIDTESCL